MSSHMVGSVFISRICDVTLTDGTVPRLRSSVMTSVPRAAGRSLNTKPGGGPHGATRLAISAGLRTSRLPNGDRIVREECKITIKVPDLTFKQLRNLYQLWRRRQSPLNRGLSAAEEQTLALVEKHGNPPPKGTPEAGRFWRAVQKDGKKAGHHWQTVNAPMTLYRKALRKLVQRPRVFLDT